MLLSACIVAYDAEASVAFVQPESRYPDMQRPQDRERVCRHEAASDMLGWRRTDCLDPPSLLTEGADE